MTIKERLDSDLKDAMRTKEDIKVSVIRLLRGAIKNAEINKKKELVDEEVLDVIGSAIKQRKDSIEQFKKGNRIDLADKEEKELQILQSYLPEQLNAEKLEDLVSSVIKEVGAISQKDISKVMAVLMPKIKGKADGSAVSQMVRNKLN